MICHFTLFILNLHLLTGQRKDQTKPLYLPIIAPDRQTKYNGRNKIMPASSKKLDLKLDGYHFSISKSGMGFPLILIHAWHPYAKSLLKSLPPETYQIISFDTPGYYSRTSGKLITNLSDLNSLLKSLLDHFGFKKVDLLGQCLGGVITLNFGAQYPERVRNLIVFTPPLLCYEPKINRALKTIFSTLEKNKLAQTLTTHLIIKRQLLQEFTHLFGGYKGLADIFAKEADLVSQTDFNPQVLFGLLSSAFKLNFWDVSKQIKARTLFVSGEKDLLTQNSSLKRLVNKMENSSYKIIPSARHSIVVKNTEELNKLVLPFLISV